MGESRSAAGYWIPDRVRDDSAWGWGSSGANTPTGVIPGEDPGTSMLGGADGDPAAPLIPIPSPPREKGGSFGGRKGKSRNAAGYWIPDQVWDDSAGGGATSG